MRSQTVDISKPVDVAIMGAYYLFMALLLLAPALYNGMALLNPDSIFHLRDSTVPDPLFDGPPYYSVFVRRLHFDQTLWPIIVVQSAMAVYVLSVLLKHTVDPQRGAWYVYSLLAAVVLTSIGMLVSQIAPDIFTPLMVISIFVLMQFFGELGRLERLALPLVIVLACSFNQANFLIGLIVVFLGFCYQAIVARRLPSRIGVVVAVIGILAGLGAMILPNAVQHQQTVITRTSNVHLLAKLIGNGIALDYLRKACPTTRYAACEAIDDLTRFKDQKPNTGPARQALSDYVLSPAVMDRMGGWTVVSAEAAKINLEAIRAQPGRFFQTAGQDVLDQLGRFASSDGLDVFAETSATYKVIGEAFPSSVFEALRNSRQQMGQLHPEAIALAHQVVVGASLLLSVILLLSVRYPPAVLSAVFTLLTAVIVNAAVTGALLTVSDRAQARIMPLVVIACVILVFAALQARSADETTDQRPS